MNKNNKRKLNRSHSARTLAKNNTRPSKMFKSESGNRKRRPPIHKKSLGGIGVSVAPSFPSLGPNLSIMTSCLDSSSLTPQSIAAAASLPGGQSPQLTQAAFAAATAALATAAAAAGMPVNQLITQVSSQSSTRQLEMVANCLSVQLMAQANQQQMLLQQVQADIIQQTKVSNHELPCPPVITLALLIKIL